MNIYPSILLKISQEVSKIYEKKFHKSSHGNTERKYCVNFKKYIINIKVLKQCQICEFTKSLMLQYRKFRNYPIYIVEFTIIKKNCSVLNHYTEDRALIQVWL